MQAQLIKDDSSTREYKIQSGEIIKIEVDEYDNSVSLFNSCSEEIGTIRFIPIDTFGSQEVHKITWMYLDKLETPQRTYLQQGLGRAAVETYKEHLGVEIIAAYVGEASDDGGHLTNDGPDFIFKLRKYGIVKK